VSPNEKLPFFLYGTLLPGGCNRSLIAHGIAESVVAKTRGRLFLVEGDGAPYPYLLAEKGVVHGELVYLHPAFYFALLNRLDRLEEYLPEDASKSLYLRRRLQVTTPKREVTAWGYLWNGTRDAGRPLLSGRFL